MRDFEKELAVLKEKVSELELDLHNKKERVKNETKVTLEECIELFLKLTGYNDWKRYNTLIYTDRGRSLDIQNFKNLEKELLRHKKEKEEDSKLITKEWLSENNWKIKYYEDGTVSTIEYIIGRNTFSFRCGMRTVLYIKRGPQSTLDLPISTIGQLKQIIRIFKESSC